MSNFNLKETIDSGVDLAIQEDLGSGDLTSSLIPEETIGQGVQSRLRFIWKRMGERNVSKTRPINHS
jgi:nicotinate-nucleotide pyrophosphorylase